MGKARGSFAVSTMPSSAGKILLSNRHCFHKRGAIETKMSLYSHHGLFGRLLSGIARLKYEEARAVVAITMLLEQWLIPMVNMQVGKHCASFSLCSQLFCTQRTAVCNLDFH